MAESGTSFKPGQTGNPGGRPRRKKTLESRCIKAVNRHVVDEWIREVKERGPNWVKCSELLVHYAYGKPKQSIEHSGGLTLEQLVASSFRGEK